MTGGNVYLSGDKAAAQSLIPEAQQCVAIVRAMRDALELDELERVFTLTGGTCRVVLGKYSEQLYIQPDPPEPPEEEEPEEELPLAEAPVLFRKLAMPWRPEGMILTPVTEAQPKGLGLPMRDVDTGNIKRVIDPGNPNELGPIEYTEGGRLPQVLLNRFANNKYMDNLLYINGLPPEVTALEPSRDPRLSERYALNDDGEVLSFPRRNQEMYYSTAPRYGHGHSYGLPETNSNTGNVIPGTASFEFNDGTVMPELSGGLFEVKGYLENEGAPNSGTVPIRVITEKVMDADEFSEPEQTQWYSHRPEELLYATSTKEYIFRGHNTFRRNEGRDLDFTRHLRGDGDFGDVSAIYVGTINPPKYFGHSHYGWMPGIRTSGGRHSMFTGQGLRNYGYADNPVENAVLFSLNFGQAQDIETSKQLAEYAMALWRGSPGHYAGIIAEQWDEGYTPFVDQYGGVGDGNAFLAVGACLNIGESTVTSGMETIFDVNEDGGGYEFWNEYPADPSFPDNTPGLVMFSANFDQRATWLPTANTSREINAFGVGGVGTFNGNNALAPILDDYKTRYFTVDNHLYYVPPNIAGIRTTTYQATDPGWPYAYWKTDDFVGIAGVHPYERDGQTWIRVVYWENTALRDTIYAIQQGRQGDRLARHGDFCTITVATFPLNLNETNFLPWRDPVGLGVDWEIEDSFQWQTAPSSYRDASTVWSGMVEFTSDGNKFAFTRYVPAFEGSSPYYNRRMYVPVALYFQDYSDQVINGASPYDPIESKDLFENTNAAIPETWEWTPEEGFVGLGPPEPITVEVDARSDDIDMQRNPNGTTKEYSNQKNHYEVSAQGSYQILPHYDENDELQHVRLEVDFYSYQRRFAQFVYQHVRDGLIPAVPTPDDPNPLPLDDYCWCQMKLVFPSGKEFVYYQANQTTQFPAPPEGQFIPEPPFYDSFTPHENSPYAEGGSFNCHILHIDVHREDIIYLKSTPHKYRWSYFVSDRNRDFDITVLDQQIIRDWSEEDEPVVMWDNPHTPPVDGEWVHGDYYGYEVNTFLVPADIPEGFIYEWDELGTSSDPVPPSYLFIGSETRHFAEGSASPFYYTNPEDRYGGGYVTRCHLFQESYQVQGFYNFHELYEGGFPLYLTGDFLDVGQISSSNRLKIIRTNRNNRVIVTLYRSTPDSYGVSCMPGNGFNGAYGQSGLNENYNSGSSGFMSTATCMPCVPNIAENSVRVVRYKDRWVIRISMGNLPFIGPKPQNFYDPNAPDDYTPPPYRPDPSGEPLLVLDSNFDLDEATGMEGVTDIYPCGVLY